MLSPSLGITASQGTGIGQQQLKAAQSQPPEEPRCRGGSSPAQGAPPQPQLHPKTTTLTSHQKLAKRPLGPQGPRHGRDRGEEEKEEPNNSGDSNPGGHRPGPAGPYRQIYIYRYPRLWIRHTTGLVGSPSRSLKIFSFFFYFSIAKLTFSYFRF